LRKNGLDTGLHAGAIGADNEQVEARLVDLRPESDRFEGALLPDEPIDRLERCRRRELQAGWIGRAVESINGQRAQRFNDSRFHDKGSFFARFRPDSRAFL
jgi:hypothetical protein